MTRCLASYFLSPPYTSAQENTDISIVSIHHGEKQRLFRAYLRFHAALPGGAASTFTTTSQNTQLQR